MAKMLKNEMFGKDNDAESLLYSASPELQKLLFERTAEKYGTTDPSIIFADPELYGLLAENSELVKVYSASRGLPQQPKNEIWDLDWAESYKAMVPTASYVRHVVDSVINKANYNVPDHIVGYNDEEN